MENKIVEVLKAMGIELTPEQTAKMKAAEEQATEEKRAAEAERTPEKTKEDVPEGLHLLHDWRMDGAAPVDEAALTWELYPGQTIINEEDPADIQARTNRPASEKALAELSAEDLTPDVNGRNSICQWLSTYAGLAPCEWVNRWVDRYHKRAAELGVADVFDGAWMAVKEEREKQYREQIKKAAVANLTKADFEHCGPGSLYDDLAWHESQNPDDTTLEDLYRERAETLKMDNVFESNLDSTRAEYDPRYGWRGGLPAWRTPAAEFESTGSDGLYAYLARLEVAPETSGYKIIEDGYRKQAAAYKMADHFEAALVKAKEMVAAERQEAEELRKNHGVKPLEKVSAEDFKDRKIYEALAALAPLDREEMEEKYREKFEELAKRGEVNPGKFKKMLDAADKDKKLKEAAARKAEKEAAAQAKADKAKARTERAQEQVKGHMTEYSDLPENCTGQKPIAGIYTVDDNGIYIDTEDYKGNPVHKLISRTPMFINRMVSGGNYVEFLHMQDGHWRMDTEEYGTLTVASEIKNLIKRYKVSVSDKNYGLLADYFQSMYDTGVAKHAWEYIPLLPGCGWHKDFSAFCVNPAQVRDAVIANAGDYEDMQAAMGPHGDREKYYKIHKELRAQKIKMFHAALIANLASVLFSIFKMQGATLNVYGTSGKGKSQAAFFAATVWGSSDFPGAFIQAIGDTKRSMQELLGFCRNICVTFDDSNNIARSDPKMLQDIAYTIANGRGRRGLTKEGKQRKEAAWCTSGVITSEQRIVFQAAMDSEGGINRVIAYPAPQVRPWSDNKIGKLRNFFSGNYGFAGPEFAAKVAELRTTIAEERDEDGEEQDVLHYLYNKFQQQLYEAAEKAGKKVSGPQVMRVAILMVADYIAEKYIYQDNIKMSAAQWAEGMDDETEIDQDTRFIQAINEDLTENAAHYWGASYAGNTFQEPFFGAAIDDVLCITPKHLLDLAHEHNEDPKLFFPWAYEHGYMVNPGLDEKGKPKNPKKQIHCKARKNPIWVYELHNISCTKDQPEAPETPKPQLTQQELEDISRTDISQLFKQPEQRAPQRPEARQISMDEYKRQRVAANFQRERAAVRAATETAAAGVEYMPIPDTNPFGDIDDDYAIHAHPASERRA